MTPEERFWQKVDQRAGSDARVGYGRARFLAGATVALILEAKPKRRTELRTG